MKRGLGIGPDYKKVPLGIGPWGWAEPEVRAILNMIGVQDDSTIYMPSTPYAITGTNLGLALNTCVVSVKNALGLTLGSLSLRQRMGFWYPCLLNTATSQSYNMVDVSVFQITWNGGITRDGGGWAGNGTNGYAKTNATMLAATASSSMTDTSISLHILSKTNTNALMCDIGAFDNGAGTQYDMAIYTRNGGNLITRLGQVGINNSTAMADSLGFFSISRNNSTQYKQLKNGVAVATLTQAATVGNKNRESISIGALNNDGSVIQYSTRKYTHALFANGWSDAETLGVYNAIATLETALNR